MRIVKPKAGFLWNTFRHDLSWQKSVYWGHGCCPRPDSWQVLVPGGVIGKWGINLICSVSSIFIKSLCASWAETHAWWLCRLSQQWDWYQIQSVRAKPVWYMLGIPVHTVHERQSITNHYCYLRSDTRCYSTVERTTSSSVLDAKVVLKS